MQIFDTIGRGNTADIADGCQMMSYSHVQEDLKRKEHLNYNLE